MKSTPMKLTLVIVALAVSIVIIMAIRIASIPQFNTNFSPIVTTTVVETQSMPAYYETNGYLETEQQVTLHSESPGIIQRLLMTEGAWVKQGTPLVQLKIDKPVAELNETIAQVSQAQDALKAAQADIEARQATYLAADKEYQRYQQLFQKQYVSANDRDIKQSQRDAALAQLNAVKSRMDQASATLKQAQAHRALYGARLDDAYVRAPFSGWVGQKMVTQGDYVQPLNPIVTMVRPGPLRVIIPVPQRYADQLAVGQPVQFFPNGITLNILENSETSSAKDIKPLMGKLTFVAPNANTDSQTLVAKATLDVSVSPTSRLKPGQAGLVRLVFDTIPNAVVVPEESVFGLGEKHYVYIVRDKKSHLTEVKLGQHNNGTIHIVSGVKAKDEVIVGGLQKAQDNLTVTPQRVDAQGKTVKPINPPATAKNKAQP
jgi:membrane fusion protein (multidrug efflux system)